jgi:hypothetical protein
MRVRSTLLRCKAGRRLSSEHVGWAEGSCVASLGGFMRHEAVLRVNFSPPAGAPALCHHGRSGYQPRVPAHPSRGLDAEPACSLGREGSGLGRGLARADQCGHPAGAASCHASSWPSSSSSSSSSSSNSNSSGRSCSGDCGCDDGGFSRGGCSPGGDSCGSGGSGGSGGSRGSRDSGALPARRPATAHAPGRKHRRRATIVVQF